MGEGRKAIIVAIHDWDSPIQVGSHAVAREFLARGWQVAYISAPLTPLHWLLLRGKSRDRLARFSPSGESPQEGLFCVTPFSLVAPGNRRLQASEWVLGNWWRTTVPPIHQVLGQKGFETVDVLFLDTIYQPFWLDHTAHKKSFYRMADNYAGFAGFNPALEHVEQTIVRRVDSVLVTGDGLANRAHSLGAREIISAPNGIELSRFASTRERPDRYKTLKGPIVVYVGAFLEWFNFEWMQYAITHVKDVNFVLIGPVSNSSARRLRAPNVHWLGPIAQAHIPAYLQHASVGIIPFDVAGSGTLVNDVAPLKLYEYLASGLPVVSAKWPQVEQMNDQIRYATDREEFVRELRLALEDTTDRSARKAQVQALDWSMTLDRFFERINSG